MNIKKLPCHCERSEAIQIWIATSHALLAMTNAGVVC